MGTAHIKNPENQRRLTVETCNDGRGVSASSDLARVTSYVFNVSFILSQYAFLTLQIRILSIAGAVEINCIFYNAKKL